MAMAIAKKRVITVNKQVLTTREKCKCAAKKQATKFYKEAKPMETEWEKVIVTETYVICLAKASQAKNAQVRLTVHIVCFSR